MERTKDVMTKFRSVIRGKNSKGGDRIQLYLSQEETNALIEVLGASNSTPKGVKLDLHISKKEYEGRTFDSAFGFVKPVSEGRASGGAPGAPGAGRFTSTPKATGDMDAKIAAIKAAALKG